MLPTPDLAAPGPDAPSPAARPLKFLILSGTPRSEDWEIAHNPRAIPRRGTRRRLSWISHGSSRAFWAWPSVCATSSVRPPTIRITTKGLRRAQRLTTGMPAHGVSPRPPLPVPPVLRVATAGRTDGIRRPFSRPAGFRGPPAHQNCDLKPPLTLRKRHPRDIGGIPAQACPLQPMAVSAAGRAWTPRPAHVTVTHITDVSAAMCHGRGGHPSGPVQPDSATFSAPTAGEGCRPRG